MKKRFGFWITAFLLFCLYSLPAYAHANLLDESPKNGQVVDRTPDQITLTFSEPLEPSLVELRLFDRNAHPIPIPNIQLKPGHPEEMVVHPPQLAEGTYTVAWNVVSEDGHPVNGTFLFSVGSFNLTQDISIPQDNPFLHSTFLTVRYFVEGLILLGAGFYWMGSSWGRRGFIPREIAEEAKRRGKAGNWILLFIGSLAEWVLYSATLPGSGLTMPLFRGEWTLIGQSPFAVMLLIQFGLLALMAIPGMIESWYALVWAGLVINLAFGGHARSIQPAWLAETARILHLAGVSGWLGALTCLMAVLWIQKKGQQAQEGQQEYQTYDWKRLRQAFVPVAAASAALVIAAGILMTLLQTDLPVLLQHPKTWGILLYVKIGLVLLMLVLALRQTIRWRKGVTPLSRAALAMELGAGAIALLIGVWMSQSPYPIKIQTYSRALPAVQVQPSSPSNPNQAAVGQTPLANQLTQVRISKLQLGKQTVVFHLPGKPEHVTFNLLMLDMADMGYQEQPLKKTGDTTYQTDISFSMSGKWDFSIRATYSDQSELEWKDTILIPSEGE